MIRLTNYEQETIIIFNEAEEKADIFTYNTTWQKHCEHKLRLKPIKVTNENGREYELSKKLIRMPQLKSKRPGRSKEQMNILSQIALLKRIGPDNTGK